MKKRIIVAIFFLICLFTVPKGVAASAATCTYEYSSVTIVATYRYGQKATYKVDTGPTNKTVKTFSISSSNFVDSNGNIICPKMKCESTISGNKRFDISCVVSSNGTVAGTLKMISQDDSEKNKINTNNSADAGNVICYYNKGTDREYGLSYQNGTKVYLIGSSIKDYEYSISEDFSASDFANKKCPEVYEQFVAKGKKIIISKNKIFTENDKANTADSKSSTYDNSVINDSTSSIEETKYISNPCEVIPKDIRDWIIRALKLVRYIALALVIVLGTLDFIKAAASGEPDSIKKAGQSFLKRLIAVIILFLLPYIVEFILNMIDIVGVDKNNINCT